MIPSLSTAPMLASSGRLQVSCDSLQTTGVVHDRFELWRTRALDMRDERFSARTLDVRGALAAAGRASDDVREALERFGAVHVARSGIVTLDEARAAIERLGFGPRDRFVLGGRTSEQWQRKWLEPGLRRMDYYPPELYLLPNNEVQYQRCGPRWVLFYCRRATTDGGRTFVHSAERVLEALARRGVAGRALVDKLEQKGLVIEGGFLDRRHPQKQENYVQSWQERFETEDPEEALARARARRDEYDVCWLRDERLRDERGAPIVTLMTRITLPAFFTDLRDGRRYLRFPRIALDGPSAKNGYRRFPLGDGQELSSDDKALLLDAYLDTREGARMSDGDLVLFDNLRFGHSRERFSGSRELYVAMAGELWDDRYDPDRARVATPPERAATIERFARAQRSIDDGPRYVIAPSALDRAALFSARTFDAEGALTPAIIAAILTELERHGAVHVRHTGIAVEHAGALPPAILAALGFGPEHTFSWGGTHSGRTERRALSRELRATDAYPPHLWLLPHNEVLYQRTLPARLLFFSATAGDPSRGGRTFVHSAKLFERWLDARGERGRALLRALRERGQRIETGFIDEHHPARAKNYFRSWQERFETDSRDEAARRCRAATHQFDECWWREDVIEGRAYFTLMTRVRVPGFFRDPVSGDEYVTFPRIALDGPSVENGYRRYSFGDGEALSNDEVDLLLHGFLATREGVHYEAGDLLLCDNVRYGHSRESFDGPRSIGVAMAGSFSTDASRFA